MQNNLEAQLMHFGFSYVGLVFLPFLPYLPSSLRHMSG